METWVIIDEFVKLAQLEKEKVLEMVANGTLKSKQEEGKFFIDAGSGTQALVKAVSQVVVQLWCRGIQQ